MPTMLKPAYAFGGVALTQMCKPYVDNWLRVRQSASDLVNAFSIMVLKTEMSDVLVGGSGDELFTRIDVFNKTRDNRGTFVLDKNAEDFSNVSAPIAGLDKLVAQSQEQMSSVSSIPLSVLLGITPTGLNASADGEIRIFYDSILSYLNEVVRPGLETLLDIVQLSLFGEIDDEITAEFETLWEMSDKDKADIRKSDAEAAVAYINGGVIDPEEERERLNNEDGGAYNGMLDGPAPEPPEVDPMDDENEAAKLPILP
jgi:phage-related protein (TIGR01555 family)